MGGRPVGLLAVPHEVGPEGLLKDPLVPPRQRLPHHPPPLLGVVPDLQPKSFSHPHSHLITHLPNHNQIPLLPPHSFPIPLFFLSLLYLISHALNPLPARAEGAGWGRGAKPT